MPWFIVVQPNGRFARFSTVVDAFTHMDMTREEALEECRREPGMGVVESEAKVRRGEAEEACSNVSPDEAGRPLARWLGCLGDVEFRHGRAARGLRAAEGARGADTGTGDAKGGR